MLHSHSIEQLRLPSKVFLPVELTWVTDVGKGTRSCVLGSSYRGLKQLLFSLYKQ